MAHVMSRSDFGNLLEKNLNVVFMSAWQNGMTKLEHKGIFKEVKGDGHEYRVQHLPGFGPMPMMPEGSPVVMETAEQGYVYNATIEDFGLGFRITQNMIDDNRYKAVTPMYTEGLAKSARDTQNKNAADVLNFAYSSSHTYPDGQPLISTSNKSKAGNWSNQLSVAADWSELVDEQIRIAISLAKDDAGLLTDIDLDCIVIPPQLKYDVARVLKSPLRASNTGLSTPLTYQPNDINAVMKVDGDTKVKVMRKLTNPKNVFYKTDEPNGLTFVNRKPLTPSMTGDWETRTKAYMLFGRWVFVANSKRTVWGNGNRP